MTKDKNKASRSRTVLLLLFILPGIVGLYLLFITFNGPPPKPALPYFGITSTNDTLQLPNFNFTNQLGQIISNDSLQDKIKIIQFFNTGCTDGCLEVVKNLVDDIQDYFKVDEDVHILSFTTDAINDSPTVLQKFGEQNEINNQQWAFLTATTESQKTTLQQFAQNSFFNVDEAAADLSIHQKLILIDKEGRIRGYYDGMDEAQTQRLQENIEVLKLAYGTHEKYR